MSSGAALDLPFDPTARWVRLTALLVGIAVLVGAAFEVRSQLDARRDAAVAEARYAFQQELTLAYDGFAEPAQQAGVALSGLREVLQQHLTITDRTGDELAEERERRLAELGTAAADLRAAASAAAPAPTEELAPEVLASLGQQLEGLHTEARQLAADLDRARAGVEAWTAALGDLRRAALQFIATSADRDATTDPTALSQQWRDEREPLQAYLAATDAASAVDGLAPVAAVHRSYVEANLAWVDEAVSLLDAGRLGAYNARLAEVFAVPDPFGFTAGLQAAFAEAHDAGVLAELDRTRTAATALFDRVAEARRLAPILLRPSDSEGGPAAPRSEGSEASPTSTSMD